MYIFFCKNKMAQITELNTTTNYQATGPLASLETTNFNVKLLQYPDNLNSDTGTNTRRPHVVKFFINVPTNSSYLSVNGGSLFSDVTPGAGDPQLDAQKKILGLNITNAQYRIDNVISLYMPDNLNFDLQSHYEDVDLSSSSLAFFGQMGEAVYDKAKKAFVEGGARNLLSGQTENILAILQRTGLGVFGKLGAAIGDNRELTSTLLQAQGVAVNPQVQLLFTSIALRTYQFDFMFSPKTQQESQMVNKIIQTFRFHAAPEVGGVAGTSNGPTSGLFFVVPSTFNIQFLFEGRENPYVNRVGESVLESVSVDYAPNGWSTFYDGSPTQIRMSLQFKETSILDKSRILQGY